MSLWKRIATQNPRLTWQPSTPCQSHSSSQPCFKCHLAEQIGCSLIFQQKQVHGIWWVANNVLHVNIPETCTERYREAVTISGKKLLPNRCISCMQAGASLLGFLMHVVLEEERDEGWYSMSINTLGPRQMDAISQTTFSNGFSWMKVFEFRLKFHWSLFPRVQLTKFQHWFR